MARFEEYSRKYSTIRMERRDGILQMTFHTNGGTIVWDQVPHTEFPEAFTDIGNDPENMVVIMTGTGGAFISMPPITPSAGGMTAGQWDTVYWEGKHLLMKLLDIEVPVIAAVNGPAHRHSEIPLLGGHRPGRRGGHLPRRAPLPPTVSSPATGSTWCIPC